jgi:glycosyltransferase involved in cell wall biosynthesis
MYRPIDRQEARRALNIEPKGPVLLIAAFDLGDRRTGSNYLHEALGRLPLRQMTVISMGESRLDLNIKGITYHHLGFVKDEHIKVNAFNAADILAHPAPVGNQPLVCLEAIACGTPVVSFSVNGLPEIVRPRQTGWLAENLTVDSYAQTLNMALSEVGGAADFRSSCRSFAEAEYNSDRQAQRYLSLFQEASKLNRSTKPV